MVQKIKNLFEEYPKTCMFVVGILCALLLVLIIFIVVKVSEHQSIPRESPEARFLLGSEHAASGIDNQAALLLGQDENQKKTRVDNRFFGSGEHLEDAQEDKQDVNVGTPAPAAKPAKSGLTKGGSAPELPADGDNDTSATKHMLTRGSTDRASVDSSRNRYLGLSNLGAADYEGYVYKGNPLSDEQGELTATLYGIGESPWN
jgi:hypothetical protein